MKWVNCFDRMPEIDNDSDYPEHFIVRCKIDGGKGFDDEFLVTAEEMRETIKGFDYCEWLD